MRYVLLAAAGLGLLDPPAASAHAFVKKASPPVGSVVRQAPAQVDITFTEAVEPAFSTIQVTDAAGERVDGGAVHQDGDATRLAVGLKRLTPGTYTVAWHALSVDTHKTQGSFSFTLTP